MNFGLKQEDINKINEIFSHYTAIEQVILYGSRAKGNFQPGSDIDLAIIDLNLSFSDVSDIEMKLDDLLLPYKIDLAQKRKISNLDLIEHINRVGKVFYKEFDLGE